MSRPSVFRKKQKMNQQQKILAELQEAASVLQTFLSNEDNLQKIEQAAYLMSQSIDREKKIISCGNGGSHCDAMHFAEELTGRYRQNRPSLPGICISDVSHLTCTANDFGFDHVFSRYIEGIGQAGDTLLAISTSGYSANILKAAEAARAKDMKVVALTGKDGGPLAGLADIEIRVHHHGFADRIQEVHIKIIHILIMLIEQLQEHK